MNRRNWIQNAVAWVAGCALAPFVKGETPQKTVCMEKVRDPDFGTGSWRNAPDPTHYKGQRIYTDKEMATKELVDELESSFWGPPSEGKWYIDEDTLEFRQETGPPFGIEYWLEKKGRA